MLKEKFIIDVDAIFMYKRNFLIKEKNQIKDGTSYCNYHFRQALIGRENDFSGKTKPQIEAIMFKNTGRKNFQHISNLKREVKKSKLPIEVVVGENSPFEVIIHDKSIIQNDGSQSEIQNTAIWGNIPSKSDIEFAAKSSSSKDINVILDNVENIARERGKEFDKDWREKTLSNLKKWKIN
jgi:hypothetical protein